MSVKLFVSVIKELLPKTAPDVDLLIYHLRPVLEKMVKTSHDRAIVNSFLCDLLSARGSTDQVGG